MAKLLSAYRIATVLLAASTVFGVSGYPARADDYYDHAQSDEALAFTSDGDEIVNPEHDSAESAPDSGATYEAVAVIKYEVKDAHMRFYTIRAVFVHQSPQGECLLSYHDIPALSRVSNDPASAVAQQAAMAIRGLRMAARVYKANPDSIGRAEWVPVADKEGCPVS